MMLLKKWIFRIVCTAMVLTLTDSLIPQKKFKNISRLAGGLVLIVAVFSPVGEWSEEKLIKTTLFKDQTQVYSQKIKKENEDLLKTIIEENTCAYILDKAAEMNAACEVHLSLKKSDLGLWCPWEICIKGALTEGQRERMEVLLERELGISPEHQQFEGTG